MARAATTADVFNAIAEPRRREIVELLARHGGLAVGALMFAMGVSQPAVSKHLAVLRKVGLVSATHEGQQRIYQLEAAGLKRMHEWIKQFEPYWEHQLSRIKLRAERRAGQPPSSPEQPPSKKGSS